MADTDNTNQSNLPRATLSRRRLIGLGAAGLLSALPVAAAAAGRNSLGSALALRPSGAPAAMPLSIGYASHVAAGHNCHGGAGEVASATQSVTLAQHLRQGDAALADTGATMRVLGLYPQDDPSALASVQSLALDVYYAPYHDASFTAWSFVNGSTPRVSAPFAFNVPLAASTGLQFGLSYLQAGATSPLDMRLRFSLGGEHNVAKLQKGTYILALPNANAALPDWRNHRLLISNPTYNSGLTLVRSDALSRTAPASNPYILLAIS